MELKIDPRVHGGDQQREHDEHKVRTLVNAVAQQVADTAGQHGQDQPRADQPQLGEELDVVVVGVFPAHDELGVPRCSIDLRIMTLINGEVVAETARAPTGDEVVAGHVPGGVAGDHSELQGVVDFAFAEQPLHTAERPVERIVLREKIGAESDEKREDRAEGGDHPGAATLAAVERAAHDKPDKSDERKSHQQNDRAAGRGEQHAYAQQHAAEGENGRGTGALHATFGAGEVPVEKPRAEHEREVEVGASVIAVNHRGKEVIGRDLGFDKPEDLLRVGDLLQDADDGEDGAVDRDDGEERLDGGAAGDADPEGAGEQPDAAVKGEHAPRAHVLKGRIHAGGEPTDVLHRLQPPVTALPDVNPGRVERLGENVTEKQQSEPEDREANELGPHDQLEVALGSEFAAVTTVDDGNSERGGGQADGHALAPYMHGAERPRHKTKQRADDDHQARFERVKIGRCADFAAKRLEDGRLGRGQGTG